MLRALTPTHIAVLSIACFSTLTAEVKKPEKENPEPAVPVVLKSKFGPRDVEVKLQDGSLFRGTLDDANPVVLKTSYGILTFPMIDLVRIERGERMHEKDIKDVTDALKALDNDEFAIRAAAQYKLESTTPAAIEMIKAARESASPESKTRIDAILKKLTSRSHAKKFQTEDAVRCQRFEATGVLQFETLKVKSRLGELAIKLEDLQTVRWLNSGEAKSMILEPNAQMGEWVDTGTDTSPGDKVAVIVSGTINPFNNNEISPVGTDNWGNAGSFMMGAVVGRLGPTGEPFLIGNGKVWTSEGKERLYLKIHWNYSRSGRSNEGSKGHYNVKISTGSMADEIDSASIPSNSN